MIINKITKEACKTTRPLWEEVFYEDSVQFTDYYFENKAQKNTGYVIGKAPYDAMMFCTPYQLQIGEKQKEISYIVGVATRKECRHQGYMRALLMHSFKEMYQEKKPFTFLMPADPAIYEPFGFQYIYEKDVWTLKEPAGEIAHLEALTAGEKEEEISRPESFTTESKTKGNLSGLWEEKNELRAAEFANNDTMFCRSQNELNGLYSVRNLRKIYPELPIMDWLAEFANNYLKKHYNIYVHRDAAYYEMQLKESEAQNGDIYVLFENGKIKAFFLYAKEGKEVFIQEVMEAQEGSLRFLQKSGKKKPVIMARIIHLEEMMKLVCARENQTVFLEIEDELIPENAGFYQWEMTPRGSKVTRYGLEFPSEYSSVTGVKIQESRKVSMHIRDLAPQILEGVFINEIV